MRIKYFTMLQNMPIFQFSRRCDGPYGLENNLALNAVRKLFRIKPNLI